VAMDFCPIVDVSMASIHNGFPIGAQLAFCSPHLLPLVMRQSSASYSLAYVCKELYISIKQLMERGSARLVSTFISERKKYKGASSLDFKKNPNFCYRVKVYYYLQSIIRFTDLILHRPILLVISNMYVRRHILELL
jgi:hypothetical protein